MRCLSLHQPWASLLVAGVKRVETRSWEIRHRGPLLIHAAKTWTGDMARLCLKEPFRDALRSAGIGVPPSPHDFTTLDVEAMRVGWNLPMGAILGRVDVLECYRTEKVTTHPPGFEDMGAFGDAGGLHVPDTERAFGDYSPGRFAFLCANFVAFRNPVPFRGMQTLFDVPDTLTPEDIA